MLFLGLSAYSSERGERPRTPVGNLSTSLIKINKKQKVPEEGLQGKERGRTYERAVRGQAREEDTEMLHLGNFFLPSSGTFCFLFIFIKLVERFPTGVLGLSPLSEE